MLFINESSNESLIGANQSEWELAASPDLSISFYIISAVWLALCGIFGISLNGVVLWAFYKDSKLRTPFNLMLLNLILSDFLMILCGIPPDFTAAIMRGWKLGYQPCIWVGFVMTLTGMSTIFTLMALSVQRCFYVWCPTTMGVYGPPYTYLALILVWVMTCSFAFPPLLGWSEYVPEKSGISCSVAFDNPKHISYSWYILIAGFILPLIIIMITSIFILVRVKQHSKKQAGMNMKSQVISSRERKVTLMVFLMVAAFVGAWSGYGTLCILRLVGLEFSSLSIGISMLIAKTGACLNPVIFIFLNNQFYETVLPKWLKRLTAKTNSVSSPPLGRSSKRSTKSKGQNIQLSNIRTIGNSTTAESQNEPVDV